ncbi:MAG: hypothetical protein ACC649_00765, partial [Myxococcota bacterium]
VRLQLREGAEVIPGRSAGRAARRRHAAIGFAIAIGALAVGAAGGAGATVMSVQATLTVEYGLTDPVDLNGVGVAIVNPIVGGDRLVSLQVGPIDYGDGGPALFTTPSVSALIISYDLRGVSGQSGSFFDLSHATTSPAKLTQNTLPIAGLARICLLFPGCVSGSTLEVDLSQNGTRGVGIGGTITASTPLSTTTLKLSLHHAPWQLAPATLLQSTISGIVTAMATGYARGSLSNTSTAAKVGGTIQLITPSQVFTQGVPGGHSDTQALFTRLTLNFVPEPGLLLLLGPGVVGLAVLGRRRMRG